VSHAVTAAAPAALAVLGAGGLGDLAVRLGYLLPLLGVGAESAGIPVPGEASLLVSSVLAGSGRLSPWGVALAGFAGAVLGDNLGYWLGRRFGHRLTRLPGLRRLYTPARLAAAERMFTRRSGFAAIFLARFAAILRILGGPLAGLHGMPWPRFALANAAGGAVWVGAVVTVGLLLGSNLHRAHVLITGTGLACSLLVVITVLAVLAVRHRRRARLQPGPASARSPSAATRPAAAVDQPVADQPEPGPEHQPRSQHEQVARSHYRLLRTPATGTGQSAGPRGPCP
jgi:membrane protein DedA with SNARE-associated domain